MKIWDPAYDPYSSLLDQKCMFCRRGSTPDLNPIRQQRSETPVKVTHISELCHSGLQGGGWKVVELISSA
ncbi:hypothetical protein J6590_068412 [Homalodisca vitripennis]|nr:hypothetical protein J6590_068412 [Homalodisca vitripennis]